MRSRHKIGVQITLDRLPSCYSRDNYYAIEAAVAPALIWHLFHHKY
ncbi:MAG: hypothetical protein KME06_21500 [Kastovskya adunca ATA6-11-RM4]|nr:hypothetical protein [Kastovskya adunca ATA6-11-RM4]